MALPPTRGPKMLRAAAALPRKSRLACWRSTPAGSRRPTRLSAGSSGRATAARTGARACSRAWCPRRCTRPKALAAVPLVPDLAEVPLQQVFAGDQELALAGVAPHQGLVAPQVEQDPVRLAVFGAERSPVVLHE